MTRLKRLSEFVTSGPRGWGQFYSATGPIFLRITNISRNSIELLFHDLQRVAAPKGAEGVRTLAQSGDLLISITADIGSVGVVPDGLGEAYVSQHVALVRPSLKKANPRFLAYFISSPFGRRQFEEAMQGGTKLGLGLDDVRDFELWVPSLPDQNRIADFLDRKTTTIDALIAKKRKLVELLAEKRAALINQAVTKGLDPTVPTKDSGIPWIGKIPAHWELRRLGQANVLMQTGPFGSQLHAESYVEGGTPIVNPTNLVNTEIIPEREKTVDDDMVRQLARHKLCCGDVVFARRGTLGRCGIVTSKEEGWLCGTGSILVRPNTKLLNPRFLGYLSQTKWVPQWFSLESVGSTMENLNTGILARLPLPCPPIEEQLSLVTDLGAQLTSHDKTSNQIEDSVTRLFEYRQALITAAVTGQLEIPVSEPEEVTV